LELKKKIENGEENMKMAQEKDRVRNSSVDNSKLDLSKPWSREQSFTVSF
jgi:hypothetical protein